MPQKLDLIVAMGADRRLHRGALAVGSAIVRDLRADWGGYAMPSRARLAAVSGITKPAVTQAIAKLVETGWIEVLQRAAGTKSARYIAGPTALRVLADRKGSNNVDAEAEAMLA